MCLLWTWSSTLIELRFFLDRTCYVWTIDAMGWEFKLILLYLQLNTFQPWKHLTSVCYPKQSGSQVIIFLKANLFSSFILFSPYTLSNCRHYFLHMYKPSINGKKEEIHFIVVTIYLQYNLLRASGKEMNRVNFLL